MPSLAHWGLFVSRNVVTVSWMVLFFVRNVFRVDSFYRCAQQLSGFQQNLQGPVSRGRRCVLHPCANQCRLRRKFDAVGTFASGRNTRRAQCKSKPENTVYWECERGNGDIFVHRQPNRQLLDRRVETSSCDVDTKILAVDAASRGLKEVDFGWTRWGNNESFLDFVLVFETKLPLFFGLAETLKAWYFVETLCRWFQTKPRLAMEGKLAWRCVWRQLKLLKFVFCSAEARMSSVVVTVLWVFSLIEETLHLERSPVGSKFGNHLMSALRAWYPRFTWILLVPCWKNQQVKILWLQ